jgi:transposase
LADDRGRPVAFALTPANVGDVVMAVPLLGAVAKPKRLLADKAYEADSLPRWLRQRKIRAAIPSTASRRTPYPLDRAAYKRRNVIERMFCRLKNWRRLATRYDRLARNYLSGLALAAIIIAWTSMSPLPSFFVPDFDGASLSSDSKDALWDRFYTGAPQRQRRSVERYNIVKRA